MFQKKLEFSFGLIIIIAGAVLGVNYYKSYSFNHNPLPKSYIERINTQEQNVLYNMQNNFGMRKKFPIVITDKIPGRLYGLTSYKNTRITIYLNKKVIQESMDYVIDSVIPHEYAYARSSISIKVQMKNQDILNFGKTPV